METLPLVRVPLRPLKIYPIVKFRTNVISRGVMPLSPLPDRLYVIVMEHKFFKKYYIFSNKHMLDLYIRKHILLS